ncbi:MAG: toxic anion resistance protein, partial [Bacilli bacterium]|nr:toxic anion resistance protein [Bacilli bacterium]
KKEIYRIQARYSKIETNIGAIQQGLEKDKIQMLKDINIFDSMYEKNLEYFATTRTNSFLAPPKIFSKKPTFSPATDLSNDLISDTSSASNSPTSPASFVFTF